MIRTTPLSVIGQVALIVQLVDLLVGHQLAGRGGEGAKVSDS